MTDTHTHTSARFIISSFPLPPPQIVDGNSKTDVSNRREPGMFCGEAEQPQTFISETSYVKVVFHTDNYTDQVSQRIARGRNIVFFRFKPPPRKMEAAAAVVNIYRLCNVHN